MNFIDILLILSILIGAYTGFKEGLIISFFSVLAIILGMLGGFKLMGEAMIALHDEFHIDEKVLPYVAFLVVFIIIIVLVNLLGRLIKASFDNSFLGGSGQVLGALLGAFKTAFMISILIWIVDSLKLHLSNHWVEDSTVFHSLAKLAPTIAQRLGSFLPVFKDVF